jgi:hypothetical protein
MPVSPAYAAENSDVALVQKARAPGLLPRTINTFSEHPGPKNLLWGPDLAGWAMWRHLALSDSVWVKPLAPHVEVINVSDGGSVKKKKPESAVANDSGYESSNSSNSSKSSVGLQDEGRCRSSSSSVAKVGGCEKNVFPVFDLTTRLLRNAADLGPRHSCTEKTKRLARGVC